PVGDDRVERRARLFHAAGRAHFQGAGHVRRHLHAGDVRLCAQPPVPRRRGEAHPLASGEQRPQMMRKEIPMSPIPQALCAAVVAALALATPSPAAAQTKPAPVAIRVIHIPIANFTPLLVAREKGYFADENLSVTWSTVSQGAVAIEAVFGGSAEIGASAVFETMVARGNGLDLMFLAAGTHIHNQPPDNSGVLVRIDDS